MVEDRVDNLLSKNSVEIKFDRSPLGDDRLWSSEESWKIYYLR